MVAPHAVNIGLWLSILSSQISGLLAQEAVPVLLSKDFVFAPGVYYHWQQVLDHQPAEALPGDAFISSSGSLQLSRWPTGKPIAIAAKGNLFAPDPTGQVKGYHRISTLGRISYWSASTEVAEHIPMPVFNPYTGDTAYVGTVKQKKNIHVRRLLKFDTGTWAEYTPSTLLLWAEHDDKLSNTLRDMPTRDLNEKLFKLIMIYNDRHPLYLPQR